MNRIRKNSNYICPKIDIVKFSCLDIMTTSKNRDENQGEWDPQEKSSSDPDAFQIMDDNV